MKKALNRQLMIWILAAMLLAGGMLAGAAPAPFTVQAPAAGAVWPVGSTQSILWQRGAAGNVKLFVSVDDGAWSQIAYDVPNSGSCGWTVKASPSSKARVRVTSMSGNSIYGESGYFTIAASAALTVTSPAAGAAVQKGATQPIRWSSAGLSGNVKIFVALDGGAWNQIAWDLPNSGALDWPVKLGPAQSAKVRVTSMQSNQIYGESAPFAITVPTPIPTPTPTPSLGAVWTRTAAATNLLSRAYPRSVAFNGKLWILGSRDGGNFSDNNDWSSSDGVTWTPGTWRTHFAARSNHSVVVFNGKLWVIGGRDNGVSQNDVWSSPDGVTWTQETAAAGFSPRTDLISVAFNGKLWVFGGWDDNDGLKNDVWSSPDGVTWKQETAAAGFSPRLEHTIVAFNGKLWVLGGFSFDNYTLKKDVWSSPDGVTWSRETAAAGFSARQDHASAVFNNKIWVIGGWDGNALANDVWSSADGVNWTQETAADFPVPNNLASVVFNDRLWVIGYPRTDSWFMDAWSTADGVSWTRGSMAGSPPTQGTFVFHSSVVFNNKIWILDGNSDWEGGASRNGAWSSADGVNWTPTTQDNALLGRYGHTSVVFNNKMWVIGGMYYDGAKRYIYSSSDGVNWDLATQAPSFHARYGHSSVVFGGKMWVMGGWDGEGTYFHDVWSSSDGVNWTQATAAAAFSARYNHTSVVFGGKMWVIGGRDGNEFDHSQAITYKSDVWSSPDGVNWTQEAAAPFSARCSHSSVVFGGRIWVIGGRDGNEYKNDIWSSSDGVNWTPETGAAAFSPRAGHTSVVFNDRMWVIEGVNNSDFGATDVWCSLPAPLAPTPTPTPTPAPSIKLTAPAGGAAVQKGTIQPIRWTSSDLAGNVKIFVALDGGAWTQIAWDVPNSGFFNWMVKLGPASSAKVRVTSMQSNQIFGESGPFVIQ